MAMVESCDTAWCTLVVDGEKDWVVGGVFKDEVKGEEVEGIEEIEEGGQELFNPECGGTMLFLLIT